jgi:hypothetical protein
MVLEVGKNGGTPTPPYDDKIIERESLSEVKKYIGIWRKKL